MVAKEGAINFEESVNIEKILHTWANLAGLLNSKAKDEIGTLYVSKILGLGDDLAEKFSTQARKVFFEHKKLNRGIKNKIKEAMKEAKNPSLEARISFWQEVTKVIPKYSFDESEIDFMVRERPKAPRDLVNVLGPYGAESNQEDPSAVMGVLCNFPLQT